MTNRRRMKRTVIGSPVVEDLSPMQYAAKVYELKGLNLPNPYLPAIRSEKYEIYYDAHRQGEILDVVNATTALYTSVGSRQMTISYDWTAMLLLENNQVIRSTSPEEVFALTYAVDHAHGNILVGGLGMGLILHELEQSKEVFSITCVERDAELIALISPHFPEVRFVNVDLTRFMDDRRNMDNYDFIFLDAGGDSEHNFYHAVAPWRVKAENILISPADKQNIVCWGEEVMRGRIAQSLVRYFEDSFTHVNDQHRSRARLRSLSLAAVDFILRNGMCAPSKATTQQIVEFVNRWEHGLSEL